MAGDEQATAEMQAAPRRGCRARLKRGARGCGLTVLALLAAAGLPWLLADLYYGQIVASELAAIHAAGEPATAAELAPKPVPDSQNAAVLYSQIFRPNFEPEAVQPRPFGFDDVGSQDVIASYLRSPDDPAKRAAAWALVRKPEAQRRLEIIRRASLRPDCVFPVPWEEGYTTAVFPHLRMFRQATYWVLANARMLAAQGRADEALAWLRVALRMAGQAANAAPVLVGEMVCDSVLEMTFTQAEGIFNETRPSPQALRETLASASKLDIYAIFRRAMIGERVSELVAFERPARELAEELAPRDRPEEPSTYVKLCGSPFAAPLVKRDEAAYLVMMADVVALADRPLREVDQRVWVSEVRPMTYQGAMITGMFPAIGGTVAWARRDGIAVQLAEFEVALELDLYRGQHGSYPAGLAELERAIGHPLPRNPLSGKLFGYERTANGFSLSATGVDALPKTARDVLGYMRLTWHGATPGTR